MVFFMNAVYKFGKSVVLNGLALTVGEITDKTVIVNGHFKNAVYVMKDGRTVKYLLGRGTNAVLIVGKGLRVVEANPGMVKVVGLIYSITPYRDEADEVENEEIEETEDDLEGNDYVI